MSKPVIVSGEASETDSEDETKVEDSVKSLTLSVQGAVITGEDSESENENDSSICSAISALDQTNLTDDNKKINHDSLLHQKLKECNGKLLSDIESYSDSTIEEAQKNLGSIDQQILRTQMTLQNASTALKFLNANSLMIKNKLHSLLSAKFLPNVNTNK